uniref:GNAT family N-acetyltransferase n=1 Tax=uncultured Ruminococcus sp. TaxID=165186 RepID=UPI0025E233C8
MIIFKVTNTLSEDEKMIRETVFIEEQKFKIEFDDTDDIATHIVMYIDNNPVGCCRLYKRENEYHIGRIAVLKPYRGKGDGEKILLEAEKVAKEKGADSISLSAQVRASGFYEKL